MAALECECCGGPAKIMCKRSGCLKNFCDTCPYCTPGPCADRNHRNTCWNRHLPIGRLKGTEVHEKGTIEDRRFVSEVLYCEQDPERQKALHQQDRKTLWFIVQPGQEAIEGGSDDPENPTPVKCQGSVHVTERFSEIMMCDSQPVENRRLRFPTLVSFIGETGAGKSTLIRALIKHSGGSVHEDRPLIHEVESPVIQMASLQSSACPTSSGVHLYQDPATSASSHPILFSDCEGFNAGGISAASFPEDLATDSNISATIPMTAHSYSSSVETEDFYAKSLYTFSDCICFVVKNRATVGKSMERLLVWAAKGSGTAVHALRHKSLILILNQQDPLGTVDAGVLRSIFLGKDMTFWRGNQVLSGIARDVFRGTDVTPERFLGLYFTSIDIVCIRDGSHTRSVDPTNIRLQIRNLKTQIGHNVNRITDIRHETWSLYSAADFIRLFSLAIQHFANNDDVFNFSEATKSTSLDHRGLEDHILALRKRFATTTTQDCRARFPPVVGSALVNKALREDTRNFNKNLQWEKCDQLCKKAVDRFHKQFRACEYMENGKRCILDYSKHGTAHIGQRGSIIRSGDFVPGIEEIEHSITLELTDIKTEFHKQYISIQRRFGTSGGYPPPSSITQHRKDVLRTMHHHLYPLYSYRTCFACLDSIPDHVLPCGHAFCETCITDFGELMHEQAGAYKISRCIFDGQAWGAQEVQVIQTKPTFAGVRILTLDGGGVRGILELATLRLLSELIGLDLHISHFFDLIVGTSTGGLIALGLGVEEMELSNIEGLFMRLAAKTFRRVRGGDSLRFGLLTTGAVGVSNGLVPGALSALGVLAAWIAHIGYKRSMYATSPLRHGMQKVFGARSSIFGSPIRRAKQRSTRVAVTCVKDGTISTAITNYNRPLRRPYTGENICQTPIEAAATASDHLERAENEAEEIKAWEAALATCAASPQLRPLIKHSPTRIYTDAGKEHNNPIFWAAREYRKIWGQPGAEPKLDIIVSIGSGTFLNGQRRDEVSLEPTDCDPPRTKGEKIWAEFIEQEGQYSAVSHRLDVIIDDIMCTVDRYQVMGEIRLAFNNIIAGGHQCEDTNGTHPPLHWPLRDRINVVAHLLTAKLFFFEPSGLITSSERGPGNRTLFQLQGRILCRLRQGSSQLKDLVHRIVRFSIAESEHEECLYQVPASGSEVQITTIDIRGMKEAVSREERFGVRHTIATYYPERNFQCICVELNHTAVVPKLKLDNSGAESKATILAPISDMLAISGFPCKIPSLQVKAPMMDTQDRLG